MIAHPVEPTVTSPMAAHGQAASIRVVDTVLLSCAVLVLYVLTLADNHVEAEDALRYVVNATEGEHLFHANHLLYNWIGWIVHELFGFFGYTGNAFLPMQLLNAVSGAAAVAVIHLFAQRIGFSRRLSAMVALAPAFCYGFWLYSVEVETYLMPIPWIMAAFSRLILRSGTCYSGVAATASAHQSALLSNAVMISLLLAVPTLINQQSVLYYFPASLGLLLGYRAHRLTDRIRAVIVLLGLGAAISLGAYALVAFGFEEVTSLREFISWTLGYASQGIWTPWSWMSPFKGIVGLGRAIAGAHSLLAYAWFDGLIHAVLPSFPLTEERFIAATLHPVTRFISAVATLLAAMLAFRIALGLILRRGRHPAETTESLLLIRVATTVLTLQAAFIVVWLPQNIEFWVTTLPWIFLLLGALLHRRQDARLTIAFGAFVLTLGISNSLGSIEPLTDPEKDYWLKVTRPILEVARPDDLVVLYGYQSGNYVELHAGSQIQAANRDLDKVRTRIARFPGRVLISSWVLDPPASVTTSESDESQTWDRDGLQALMKCYEPKLKELARSDDQIVWEVVAPIPDCN